MNENAKPTKTPRRKGTLAAFIAAAALAVAAGFMAVYVTLGPGGNRAVAPQPPEPAGATAPDGDAVPQGAPPTQAADGPLAGLNRGEMTAFVIRPDPREVADVAFVDAHGEDRSLSDWRGRVVLLNLWATWCAPCREEMPALDRLQDALGGDDFEVVAVSLDLGSADKPLDFLDEYGIEHLPLYHDSSARLGQQLQAIGMPTTLLIDRDGREVGRLAGPAEWDAEDAQRLIRAALGDTD